MEDIEFNFSVPGTQKLQNSEILIEILQKYTNALWQFRTVAEQIYHVRPLHFDNYIFHQYFQQHQTISRHNGINIFSTTIYYTQATVLRVELLKNLFDRRRQILYWLFYLTLLSLCVFLYRNENSYVVVEQRVYPSMKIWRRMTLPLIQRFPRLTELYDESCLMENPFYQIEQLNCDVCSQVNGVLDLNEIYDENYRNVEIFSKKSVTAERDDNDDNDDVDDDDDDDDDENEINNRISEKTLNGIVPFVFSIKQDPIDLNDIYNIYMSNYDIFRRDAYRVQSTNHDITNLEQLFSLLNQTQNAGNGQAHNLWRCNRMLPARLLRQLFARPTHLPNMGIAMERFIAIDTAQAPAYKLPDTECDNVYVQQAMGTRFIILRPTSECRHKCRTLSIRLPQSSVLSYNWWYWKPISAPDPASNTHSISLIGSYC